MSTKRQKSQMELAFVVRPRGEAADRPNRGLEVPVAAPPTESPAMSDQLMGLQKQTMLELATCRWVAAKKNVILVGGTGLGSSASCPLTGTAQGQNITCTFTPGPGQIVTVLTDGGINKMGSLVSLPGPQYSYTMVASNTGDHSIAVTFAAGTTYSLTVNAAAGITGYGYVTSTPSGVVSCGASGCSTPGTCCSTASALLDATYAVTLTSTARAGDTFTGWTGGRCNGVATQACTMTMPASADIETATYRGPIANVTVTGSGSASCPLTGTAQGQNITCTFTPGPSQIVTVLTDGGINKMGSLVSLPGPQYSYTMVAGNTGDHSIAVTFAAGTTYSLTVNAAAGNTGYGYVTSTPSGVVSCGASSCSTPGTCCSTTSALLDATYGLQLTGTPRTGDTFAGWTGGQCNGVATSACTLTMPASADTETANFRGPKAMVTVSGSNGTATCPATSVAQGQNITCTFTPTFGYVVGTLTDNGTNKLGSVVAGAAPTYTYTMVADSTGDHSLIVSFASAGASYSLTVGTASPETGYGYVTSNSTPAVTCGTSTCNSSTASCCNGPVATPFYATYGLTLTATARTGDTFTGWTGGQCDGVLTNACAMIMPASADAETAYFRGPIATVTVSGSNGTASCPATGVAQGQNIKCTFTPSFGYVVGTLTDNGTNKLGSVVAGAAPTYTYTMVADSTGDHSLIVSFASAGASYSLTVGTASPETGYGYEMNCVIWCAVGHYSMTLLLILPGRWCLNHMRYIILGAALLLGACGGPSQAEWDRLAAATVSAGEAFLTASTTSCSASSDCSLFEMGVLRNGHMCGASCDQVALASGETSAFISFLENDPTVTAACNAFLNAGCQVPAVSCMGCAAPQCDAGVCKLCW